MGIYVMATRAPHSNTVLTIDSDPESRASIGRAMAFEGFDVIEAADARSALRLARTHHPDVIILDTALADMNGLDLCGSLRSIPLVDQTPILCLSIQRGAHFAAEALDRGADDFLRKPFATRELRARVRALMRRATRRRSGTVKILHLDPTRYTVRIDSRRVELTPTEFSLLQFLCDHHNEHHTAQSLLERLWEYPPGGGDKALVRNHIRNLRRKIEENPERPIVIVSQHGRGYVVNARLAQD